MKSGRLQSTRGAAAALGISAGTLTRFFRAGIVPAEVAEGRVIVFDVEKCRGILAARAKAAAENRPKSPVMVPTC